MSNICRALGLPDKECDIEVPDHPIVYHAIKFFADKRKIRAATYKDLPLEETIYRLQKQYPEFCLLCFWFDNGISKQQTQYVAEHSKDDTYQPADLMKAYWASGLCKTIKEIKGPVWPIQGYTKELYELLNDDDSVLRASIEVQMKNYREWETQWAAPIDLQNGFQTVGYALYYTELLSHTEEGWFSEFYDTFDEFISYWMWNDKPETMAVNPNTDWPLTLCKTAPIGQGSTTAYLAIKQMLGKRFPKLFCFREEDEKFKICFNEEMPIWEKNIRLRALAENRDLVGIELCELQQHEVEENMLLSKMQYRAMEIDLSTQEMVERCLKDWAKDKLWWDDRWLQIQLVEGRYEGNVADLYIDKSASDDLVLRRAQAFLSTHNIEVNNIFFDAVATDNWMQYLEDKSERQIFALYRDWLCLLNKIPKNMFEPHQDWV